SSSVNPTSSEKTRKIIIPKLLVHISQNIKQKQKSSIPSQNISESFLPVVSTHLSPFSATIKLLEEERNFETTTTSPFTSDTLELPESTLLYPSSSYFFSSQSSTVPTQVDLNI
ncbi:5837_t:CDS:1, partial [Diversispora eburnea]